MKRKRRRLPDQVDPNCAEDMIGDDPEPEGGWRSFDEDGNRLPSKPAVQPAPTPPIEKLPSKKP